MPPGKVALDFDVAIVLEGQSVAQAYGLHYTSNLMVAIAALTQYLERKVYLGRCRHC
jgi:hypothetical protein